MIKNSTSLILFLFINIYFTGFCQTYKAQLLNLKKEPVKGVKVFYNQSTISTYTNDNGVFEMPLDARIPNPRLVFFHPNYQIYEVSNTEKLRPVYYLKPKKAKTETLNPSAAQFTKDEMYAVFKEHFLGKTKNQNKIRILNKDVVQLHFDRSNNKFTATTTEPIQIRNNMLGYSLEYYLQDFEIEYSVDTLANKFIDYSFFFGYSLFNDVDGNKQRQREKAFEGTLEHFFQQIINKNYRKIKSKVFVDDQKIKPKDLFEVRETEEGLYKLYITSELADLYVDSDFTFFIQTHYSEKGDRTYHYNVAGKDYYENKPNEVTLFRPYILVDKYGNALEKKYFDVSGEILDIDLLHMLPLNHNLNH